MSRWTASSSRSSCSRRRWRRWPGFILAARFGSTRPDIGTGLGLTVITVTVLGGVSIYGGSGTMVGAVLALILVSILRFGMGLINLQGQVQDIVIGALLILSILVPKLGGLRQAVASPQKGSWRGLAVGASVAVLFVLFFFWSRSLARSRALERLRKEPLIRTIAPCSRIRAYPYHHRPHEPSRRNCCFMARLIALLLVTALLAVLTACARRGQAPTASQVQQAALTVAAVKQGAEAAPTVAAAAKAVAPTVAAAAQQAAPTVAAATAKAAAPTVAAAARPRLPPPRTATGSEEDLRSRAEEPRQPVLRHRQQGRARKPPRNSTA
ncbi:MAG: hypothetical protein U0768_13225 [Anaerolineae bacterium]